MIVPPVTPAPSARYIPVPVLPPVPIFKASPPVTFTCPPEAYTPTEFPLDEPEFTTVLAKVPPLVK